MTDCNYLRRSLPQLGRYPSPKHSRSAKWCHRHRQIWEAGHEFTQNPAPMAGRQLDKWYLQRSKRSSGGIQLVRLCISRLACRCQLININDNNRFIISFSGPPNSSSGKEKAHSKEDDPAEQISRSIMRRGIGQMIIKEQMRRVSFPISISEINVSFGRFDS